MISRHPTVVLKAATCLITDDPARHYQAVQALQRSNLSCRVVDLRAGRDLVSSAYFDVILFDLRSLRYAPGVADGLLAGGSWVNAEGSLRSPVVALADDDGDLGVTPTGIPIVATLSPSASEAQLIASVRKAAKIRSIYASLELAQSNVQNFADYLHSTNAVLRSASPGDFAPVLSLLLISGFKHMQYVARNLKPLVHFTECDELIESFAHLQKCLETARAVVEALEGEVHA